MTDLALLDGVPATTADLTPLAFAGFAHFTAMQVRAGLARGLDLHLARLRHASTELFGTAMPDSEVRSLIAQAVADLPDASLTVTMVSRSGEFTAADDRSPAALIRTAPPSDGPTGPLRLDLARHERWRPAIKHVGEGAKTFFLQRAIARGFDDAAFMDGAGRIGEATIWNLAFWDGTAVVWPEAAVLAGTTMGILRRQLATRGVPQRVAPVMAADLRALTGAAVMNSWTPAVPVTELADHRFTASDALADVLRMAYTAEPWVAP